MERHEYAARWRIARLGRGVEELARGQVVTNCFPGQGHEWVLTGAHVHSVSLERKGVKGRKSVDVGIET